LTATARIKAATYCYSYASTGWAMTDLVVDIIGSMVVLRQAPKAKECRRPGGWRPSGIATGKSDAF